MHDGEGRLGQIGRYWLSRRRNSAAWCRTWFDASARQTCRASLGTEDLDEAKLALAAWITANAKPERTRPEDAPLETYLVRYLEQHAKYLPSAEPTRSGLSDGPNSLRELSYPKSPLRDSANSSLHSMARALATAISAGFSP